MEADKGGAAFEETILIHRVLPPLFTATSERRRPRKLFTSLMWSARECPAIDCQPSRSHYRKHVKDRPGDGDANIEARNTRGETTPKTSMLQWKTCHAKVTQSDDHDDHVYARRFGPGAQDGDADTVVFAFIFGFHVLDRTDVQHFRLRRPCSPRRRMSLTGSRR